MNEEVNPPPREKPTCVAIVICNEVIEDKRTNNKTLVGLFNRIVTASLPAQHPRCYVMVSLTNLKGRTPVVLQFRSPSNELVMSVPAEAETDAPHDVLDLIFELRGLPLAEEGTYFVDVLVDNEPLSERRFLVELARTGS